LVIAQVAGSLLLLVFATQAYRGLRIILSSPAWFRTDHVLVASFNPTLARDSMEHLYLPLAQNPTAAMTLMLQTEGTSAGVASPLRDLVRSLDSRQPVYGVRSIEEIFDTMARTNNDVVLAAVAGLGILGLVLALDGLYGLMTYSVSLRQREIGIRMAVGPDPAGVVRMVLKQGMILAGSGVVIGLVLSFAAGKPTAALVGGRGFYLPLVALVTLALLAMAALGAYLPARRASLVDPNTVLRQE
jgi:cell division protein FtsX